MRLVAAIALLLGLAACRQDQAASPPDLPPPLPGGVTPAAPEQAGPRSRPYQYRSATLRSPFEPSVAGAVAVADGRARQPLEQFRLAQLRMVGTLATGGARYALVADPTGTIHRVAVGDYLGADNGRITGISRQAIALRETVRAGPVGQAERGAWTSRARTLPLAVRAEPRAEDATVVPPAPSESEPKPTNDGGER